MSELWGLPFLHSTGDATSAESKLWVGCANAHPGLILEGLREGADPSSWGPDKHGERAMQPLHYLVDAHLVHAHATPRLAECSALLTGAGARPDRAENPRKMSPMEMAAAYGCRALVEAWLDWGCRVDGLLFDLIAESCDADTARLLLDRGADPLELNRFRSSALTVARERAQRSRAPHWRWGGAPQDLPGLLAAHAERMALSQSALLARSGPARARRI